MEEVNGDDDGNVPMDQEEEGPNVVDDILRELDEMAMDLPPSSDDEGAQPMDEEDSEADDAATAAARAARVAAWRRQNAGLVGAERVVPIGGGRGRGVRDGGLEQAYFPQRGRAAPAAPLRPLGGGGGERGPVAGGGRRRGRERDEEVQAEEREYAAAAAEDSDDEVDIASIRLQHTQVEDFFDDERHIDEDDEPEEHAAGMILPSIVLTHEEVYFRSFYQVICAMGTETTRLLNQLLVEKKPLTSPDRARCNAWVKYWTAYMVENHYTILGRVMVLPLGEGGAVERISGTSCMMWELFRLKLILSHHMLHQLRDWKIRDSPFLVQWLLETPGIDLDPKPIKPEDLKENAGPGAVEKYEKAMRIYEEESHKFRNNKLLADTPILLMKQSQAKHVVQFITSRLEIIPYHKDIRQLIDLLELKTSMFFCRTMPPVLMDVTNMRTDMRLEADKFARQLEAEIQSRINTGAERLAEYQEAMQQAIDERRRESELPTMPGAGRFTINRDYLIFCSCYFYPLVRAMYYAESFPRLELERAHDVASYLPVGAVQRMEAWCRRLAKGQGDKYLDRLEDVAAESLVHHGDMEWLTYRHPDESTNVAVVLRKVRGEHAYLDYHAQTGLSSAVLLDQVGRCWTSNLYVMYLFDRYLSTYKGTNWMAGYVIDSKFIDEDETRDKWMITREPMLITIFSNFWLLLDRKVLQIDCPYTALCMWMLSIRRTRKNAGMPKDCLADNTNIGDLIDTILEGKGLPEYVADAEAHREYVSKLKRGLPTTSTRVRI